MSASSTIRACRSCEGRELLDVLDLGLQPLANRLLDADELDQEEPRFPLRLVFCPACGLVQITETVSPELLFRDYPYFSSVSDALLEHSREHAEALVAARGLGAEHRVVEVASNDGYLLQYFAARGVPVLGIEPARNVAEVARERGIPTRAEFFGREVAAALREEGVRADVLLANNVLAHVADLNGFVAGVARLLAPGGVAELEFPYVVDLVDRSEFDTVYHEHLCYFSAHAVEVLARRHGLVFTDVRRLPIHGGSLRVTLAAALEKPGRDRVEALLGEESARGVNRIDFHADLRARVEALRGELRALLTKLAGEGRRIVAYGASAKGSTLLNHFGIDGRLLDCVVDRSPAKQGRYTPGTHLPIRPAELLLEERPDYALLLTWNFAEEILAQQAAWREAGGRFVLPLPEVRVV